ncbi:MAG: VOC family protein [Geminicoccaceae bacterium]
MEIRELHHVSVPVSELERSKQFYREVLGLAELPRPPFPFPGAWFRLGDRELHLIGDSSPETGAAAGVDARRLHFAIRVASFQAALAWLEERGFRENAPAGDPSRLVVLPNSVVGYPQLYLLDPDRHLIEINAERLDG